jgi:hypothetical protein
VRFLQGFIKVSFDVSLVRFLWGFMEVFFWFHLGFHLRFIYIGSRRVAFRVSLEFHLGCSVRFHLGRLSGFI